MNGISVEGFQEKPVGDGAWINGGFFVLSPDVLDLIDGDSTVWEREPMERLAAIGATGGVQASGVLAADGHAAREELFGSALGKRQSAVESLALSESK